MSHIQPYCTRCNAADRESGPCVDGICDACHAAKTVRPLDPATLASQHAPRPAAGLGADLWAMFADTHRPTY